jgi:hypothetical protein
LQSRQYVSRKVDLARIVRPIPICALALHHHNALPIGTSVIERDRCEAAIPAPLTGKCLTAVLAALLRHDASLPFSTSIDRSRDPLASSAAAYQGSHARLHSPRRDTNESAEFSLPMFQKVHKTVHDGCNQRPPERDGLCKFVRKWRSKSASTVTLFEEFTRAQRA